MIVATLLLKIINKILILPPHYILHVENNLLHF